VVGTPAFTKTMTGLRRGWGAGHHYGNTSMDNQTLLNEIKIRRDLHSAIKHMAVIAVRLFELESRIEEVRQHLGLDKTETQEAAS
jgi:hypothetical protein